MPTQISTKLNIVTTWIFVGIGAFTFCLTLIYLVSSLYKVWYKGQKKPGPIALLVQAILPWAPLFRVIDIVVVSTQGTQGFMTVFPNGQPYYEIVLGGAPGYILCASYIVLILFWRDLYISPLTSKKRFVEKILLNWGICAGLIFLIWFVLLVCLAAIPNHQQIIHHIEAGYASLLSLLVSALFFGWGLILGHKLWIGASTDQLRRVFVTVSILSAFCCLIFLVRSICVALNAFVLPHNQLGLYVDHWLLYVLCEFLSSLLLLFVVAQPFKGCFRHSHSHSHSQPSFNNDDATPDFSYALPKFEPPRKLYSKITPLI